MILTGHEIIRRVKSREIVISPFRAENVNPNSYNFTLSDTLRVYENKEIDVRKEQPSRTIKIGPEGIVLEPRRLYLGSTIEVLGSTQFVPTYAARSSVARLGMFINLSASLGDIGFVGHWTLQLLAMHPIRLYAGMCIGQMMFWKPKGLIKLYSGKYQGARGALVSRIHQDFVQKKLTPASIDLPIKPLEEVIGQNASHTANGEI